MNTASYTITGGDFDRAGLATNRLKQSLKKLAMAPDALRRVLIAAYEAEANIVVHAHKGTLHVALSPSRIDIEVADEGPGIPDIERAMKEGFSTASKAAMALGFGAGMGLPSIKKNTDSFAIESEVGRGTRVLFSIRLSRQEILDSLRNSLQVVGELCRKCLRCLHVCPTRALRIRQEGPEILEHLCVECAACIDVCETGALRTPGGVAIPKPSECALLVVPASFLVGFGPEVTVRRVLKALSEMGFRHIRVLEEWEDALHGAALDYARADANAHPVLSPLCPAVVNLIEMRFPSLIQHLAPFLSPVEAVREELAGKRVVLAVSCPAQYTVLGSDSPSPTVVVNLSRLRQVVFPVVARTSETADAQPCQGGSGDRNHDGVLRVSGLRHVIAVLDKVENGLLADYPLVELLACEQGCFGASIAAEEPFVARDRWRRTSSGLVGPAKTVHRKVPFAARSGMRLDNDMSRAIEKLSEIDRLVTELPGRNCGVCGAPTCSALAEDVVLGRAQRTACPYRTGSPEENE